MSPSGRNRWQPCALRWITTTDDLEAGRGGSAKGSTPIAESAEGDVATVTAETRVGPYRTASARRPLFAIDHESPVHDEWRMPGSESDARKPPLGAGKSLSVYLTAHEAAPHTGGMR